MAPPSKFLIQARLREQGMNYDSIAADVGCDKSTVSLVLDGKREPSINWRGEKNTAWKIMERIAELVPEVPRPPFLTTPELQKAS